MNSQDLKSLLKRALGKDLSYPEEESRLAAVQFLGEKVGDLKDSAVLILFGFNQKGPAILYTKRTEFVEKHKGQMAFPGGACDAEDLQNFETTALRETEEEVGIPREKVQIVGVLPSLPTVTGYLIHPIVGILKESIEGIALRLSEAEIDEAVWVPLEVLMDPLTYRLELKEFETGEWGIVQYRIHVYQVGRHRIWGATGSLTKNLIDRLSD